MNIDLSFLKKSNLIIFLLIFNIPYIKAQNIQRNINDYNIQTSKNALYKMYNVKTIIPSIYIDLKYASEDNFMQKKVYNQANAYLRLVAINALKKVQSDLLNKGFSLKIFDAYRPYFITELMYKLSPNKQYVANPKRGSTHNRGITIDCTLVDIKTGKEVNMGTAFDSFSKKASHNYLNFEKSIIDNRKLLKTVMEKHGFVALQKEWWHYNLSNPTLYPMMNFDFKTFEN